MHAPILRTKGAPVQATSGLTSLSTRTWRGESRDGCGSKVQRRWSVTATRPHGVFNSQRSHSREHSGRVRETGRAGKRASKRKRDTESKACCLQVKIQSPLTIRFTAFLCLSLVAVECGLVVIIVFSLTLTRTFNYWYRRENKRETERHTHSDIRTHRHSHRHTLRPNEQTQYWTEITYLQRDLCPSLQT